MNTSGWLWSDACGDTAHCSLRTWHAKAADGLPWGKVGIELPSVTVDDDAQGGGPIWMAERSLQARHITVVVVTSDAAGDQAAALRRLAEMVRGDEFTCIIAHFCSMHQLHLVVGRQLKRAMGGKYISHLATLVNLWRSPPNPPRVRQALEMLYSAEVAERLAATPPPAAVRGRWGAVHESERHLLRASRSQLEAASCPHLSLRSPAHEANAHAWR